MMIQRQQKYDHLMYHFVTNSTFGSLEFCLMKLLRMNCSVNIVIKTLRCFLILQLKPITYTLFKSLADYQ